MIIAAAAWIRTKKRPPAGASSPVIVHHLLAAGQPVSTVRVWISIGNLLIRLLRRKKSFSNPLGKLIGSRYGARSGLTARCDPE
jgi:hypothetical protein